MLGGNKRKCRRERREGEREERGRERKGGGEREGEGEREINCVETGEKSSVIQSPCYAVPYLKFRQSSPASGKQPMESTGSAKRVLTTSNPLERKVHAIMSSPSTSDRKSPCPFCGLSFIHVANHLKHCKQRHGRDYSSFLVS